MDVTLPNGRVIQGVPDGTTKAQVMEKAIAAGLAQASDFGELSPPEGGSVADPLAQGLSFGFSDEIAGALGAIPASFSLNDSFADKLSGIPDAYRGIRDAARGNNDAFTERNPNTALSATLAGGLLSGGAGLARTTAGTVGKQFVGRSAAAGAGSGALAGAGSSEADTVAGLAEDTAVGGLVGGVTGGAFSAAGQGLTQLAQRARSAEASVVPGMQLTPGQRYGSETLQRIEAGLESFPLTSGAVSKLKQNNQSAINAAAAESIGESGDALTSDVLALAHKNLGDKFNQLTQGRKIPVDDQLEATLENIGRDSAEGLFDRDVGVKALSKFTDKLEGGHFTDKDYQRISSQISKKMRSPSLEWEDKEVLMGIKGAMDDAVERSLGPEDLAQFREVREQWRNLVMLEKGQNVRPETGNVSGRSLANTLKREDPAGYLRGGNTSPLYEAARASQQFAPIVGDSGTASRIAPQLLMQGVGGAGVSGLAGGDPLTGLAAGLSLPVLTRMYLRGQAPSLSPSLLPGVGGATGAAGGLLSQ